MKTLQSAVLFRPVLSQASALRLVYNAAFALWLFLIAGATLSLARLPLTEEKLLLGGFLLVGFNFLAGLLLLMVQLMVQVVTASQKAV